MKITDRYQSPADIPAALPVFPLRNCILLPRASLPLNIFEPRYLRMIEDVIAAERLLVIVQPARGLQAANDDGEGHSDNEFESPPGEVALRATGCVGRVTAFQELDDGRVIVSLSGVARCSLTTEVKGSKPYRTFKITAEPFARDFVAGHGEDDVPREHLLATLKRFLEARNLKADWQSIGRSGNEQLVNSLSVMSPYGPEEKQALLEGKTLKARAEMLIALAEMELAASGSGTPGSTLQ